MFTTKQKLRDRLSFFRMAVCRAVMAVATCVLRGLLNMLEKPVRQTAFPAIVIVDQNWPGNI
ncbi:MAG: hypothetical protein SCM11_09050 [Bacillota bacterium]|nr:hypothetical protein [Bacillota bacterium]